MGSLLPMLLQQQRAPENEINTARRLLKIGFAPVDWLYSESLNKSYKQKKVIE
jgi:hypothetical protein